MSSFSVLVYCSQNVHEWLNLYRILLMMYSSDDKYLKNLFYFFHIIILFNRYETVSLLKDVRMIVEFYWFSKYTQLSFLYNKIIPGIRKISRE